MKTILKITFILLLLLAISVFSRTIGGAAGEFLAKREIASHPAQTDRVQESAKSAWMYTHKTNAMTGVVTKTASVGDREIRLERFSTSAGESGLHLLANPFRLCRDRRKCNVLVRLDDQEPKRFRLHYQTDDPSMATFDSHETILSSLATAERMRVSKDPYLEGEDFLEFNVAGFEEHATSIPENEANVEAMTIEYTPEQAANLAASWGDAETGAR